MEAPSARQLQPPAIGRSSSTPLRSAIKGYPLFPSWHPETHLLVVVPVVGILSDLQEFKPVLNADEVDGIFYVPLEMFLKDEDMRSEEREWMGQEFTIHYFNYEKGNQKYVIWGLIAGILIHAASIVYKRPPDFAERRVQFNLSK